MTITLPDRGQVDVDEQKILTFPRGILGFEAHTRFVLLNSARPPFYWLQSLSDIQTAFVLISPEVFRSDYQLSLEKGELELLAVKELEGGELILQNGQPAELLVFSIVTISAKQHNITANLQGPIIINTQNHLGMQGIQTDDRWQTRHYILEEMSSGKED